MLEQGAHAVGSVDRVLASTMLRLGDDTADHLYTSFTPLRVRYDHGTRPELEAIIQRRSDWCSDVARVACVRSQVAGIPCRLVYLFDLHHAYSGHVIVEAHRAGHWGALDASTGVVYTTADGQPASVWHLMNHPELIDHHGNAAGASYSTRGEFSAAGIANYGVWERERFDYTVSGMDDYYRSILSMAARGWPGGIRWLHGKDDDEGERAAPRRSHDPSGRGPS